MTTNVDLYHYLIFVAISPSQCASALIQNSSDTELRVLISFVYMNYYSSLSVLNLRQRRLLSEHTEIEQLLLCSLIDFKSAACDIHTVTFIQSAIRLLLSYGS